MYWSAALLWSDFWNNVYITTTTNDDAENRDANEPDPTYLVLLGIYSESNAHPTWKYRVSKKKVPFHIFSIIKTT